MSEQRDLGEYVSKDNSVNEQADDKLVTSERPSSRFWPDLPEDWSIASPERIYNVNPRYSPDDKEITYIKMDALETEIPHPQYYEKRVAEDYGGKKFSVGDTLLARITPCTENGKAAFVSEMETQIGIGSTEFVVLSPKDDKIHPWFLYYVAKSYPIHEYAISRMRGSTGRQRVPFDVFRREIDLPLPPMGEQRRIAGILNNIDYLIDETQKIVDQAKRLRGGMMQDMLQNGIHEEQKRQTESRFGKLPESWDVKQLNEIGKIVGRTAPEKDDSECWGGDIPWATPSEITSLEGPTINDTEEHITEHALEKVSSNLLPPGSILLTTRATIGESAVNTVEMTTNQGFKNLIPGDDLDTWYAYYRLKYEKDFLASLSKGSTFPEVGKDTIEKFEIPVPPLEEQQKIGGHLKSIDDLILTNKSTKQQYKRLKRGLMQDLLSGEVRTKDVHIDIPEEVAAYG